jgi:predicted metal-binding membrane protein
VNSIVNDQALTHLDPAETRLAAVLARPRAIAIACIVALAALGWIACGLMSARPGAAWLEVLCGPAPAKSFGAAEAALILAMWAAMTLAMMLPTAGPMILTYAEIADTAARKREPVVSPLVLASGYVAVWLGFALGAASIQTALIVPGMPNTADIRTPLAAAIFLAAGIYQFTRLKLACLTLCQRPFPFFFSNWTSSARGVFALGLRQGIYCLGCCWALMLIMLAVGTMNALWMAALGVVMTIEKLSTGKTFSRALGGGLILIGVALVAVELK